MRPVSVTATSSGVSAPVRVDRVPNGGFAASIQTLVSVGGTYSVEKTNFDPPAALSGDPKWTVVPGLSNTTVGGYQMLSAPPAYIRLNTTSVTSGGSVTTNAPTYTTGNNSAVSLDTSGNLRAVVSGVATASNQTPPVSAGGSAALATPVQGIVGGTAVPISAASLPLPAGAATAANQTAPVSAGTNSTSGTPIQGIQGGVLVPTGASATIISQAPAVTSAVYSAGYCMGGLLSFTSATRAGSEAGLLQSVKVTFASGIQPSLDFIGFTTSPTASTITDHTALAIAGADLTKTLPAVHLTDVVSLGTPTQVQAVQQALEFVLGSGSTFYGCIVNRTSAGVTPGSTSDMAVNVAIIQQ